MNYLILKIIPTVFLLNLTHSHLSSSLLYPNNKSDKLLNKERCPNIYPKKFIGYVPFANKNAGNFSKMDSGVAMTVEQCVQACCDDENCNIVFMYTSRETGIDCFKVQCDSNEKCRPVFREAERFRLHASMVLVRPVPPTRSWSEFLPDNLEDVESSSSYDSAPNEDQDHSVLAGGTPCTPDTGCSDNEFCNPAGFRCECKPGFERAGDLGRVVHDFDRGEPEFENGRSLEESERRLDNDRSLEENGKSLEENRGKLDNDRRGFGKKKRDLEDNRQFEFDRGEPEFENGRSLEENGKSLEENRGKLDNDKRSFDKKRRDLEDIGQSLESEKKRSLEKNGQSLEGGRRGFAENGQSYDRRSFDKKRRSLEDSGKGLGRVERLYESRKGRGACVSVMDGSELEYVRTHTENTDNAEDVINPSPILSSIYSDELNPSRLSSKLNARTEKLNPLRLSSKPISRDSSINPLRASLSSESELNPSLPSTGGVLNPLLSPGQDESSKVLTVSIKSKSVKLPENEVQLSSYVVPVEKDEPYHYQWTLLSSPEGGAETTMMDQNQGTLKLRKLIRGVYVFRVNVTSRVGSGTATGQVTVLPADRINQPPKAIINPSTLTVKLPNTVAVLDGTPSTDDDHIVSYRWELQQGPLEYKPPALMNVPLLRLDNLNITGNYTFKLSVKDSNNEVNSTTANITVIKVRDYPPEANAGPDTILYLPNTNVTLNGNLSTDDHGLVSYEWTLRESNQHKPVDMQKSKTPYLQLSNLELGTYTFTLKVTDGSNQTSTADVHVFVKQPAHEAPRANAGGNQTVTLPRTWVVLDASRTSPQVTNYTWVQRSGPSRVVFVPTESQTDSNNLTISPTSNVKINATNLTKGIYRVELVVRDVNNNNASDVVTITVMQNGNQAPKANAGDNMILYLPQNYIVLNGSKSSDDLRIVSYLWTREPSSNALGDVIMNSDTQPVMILTNIVMGRYMFKLTVQDEQGLRSDDTVSVIVKPDPLSPYLVSLLLNIQASRLSQSQVDNVLLKLNLIFPSGSFVRVRSLSIVHESNLARFEFFVNTTTKGPEKSRDVVATIRDRLALNRALLDLDVVSLRTYRCENDCSGHGKCLEDSRVCLCESFWMRNLLARITFDPLLHDDNCDWSLLYVILVLLLALCTLLLMCVCLLRGGGARKTAYPSAGSRYKYRSMGTGGGGDGVKFKRNGVNGSVKLGSLMRLDSSEERSSGEWYSSQDEEAVFDKVKLLANGGGKKRGLKT